MSIGEILGMIERRAPQLMKQGGGSLPREEAKSFKTRPMSKAKRARVIALGREGNLNRVQIAKAVGVSTSAVAKIISRNNLTTPDGRLAENKRRAKR